MHVYVHGFMAFLTKDKVRYTLVSERRKVICRVIGRVDIQELEVHPAL